MPYTYVGANAIVQGTGATTLTPTVHASNASGDLIVIAAVARAAAETISTPSGYTLIYDNDAGDLQQCLFAKIGAGSEADPVVTFSGTARHAAQVAVFRGSATDLSGSPPSIRHAAAGSAAGSNTVLQYPALTITDNNCLVLMFGRHVQINTSTESVSALAGFTVIGTQLCGSGSATPLTFAFAYQIQTTATNISSGSWTSSGTIDSNTQQTIGVALKAGSGASGRNLLLGVG